MSNLDCIDSETIETDAGVYTVAWVYDEYAEQPDDEGFVLAVDGRPERINIEHGDAGSVVWSVLGEKSDRWDHDYRSGAALVRWLTLTGKKGVTLVDEDYFPVEPSPDRFETVHGVAWAPDDEIPDPEKYVHNMLKEWQAWAKGDCFGWIVTAPDGEQIESVWGYYGFSHEREYTLNEAIDTAKWHAAEKIKTERLEVEKRLEAANLVGAGFVGII